VKRITKDRTWYTPAQDKDKDPRLGWAELSWVGVRTVSMKKKKKKKEKPRPSE
jgi:hypothetical protein